MKEKRHFKKEHPPTTLQGPIMTTGRGVGFFRHESLQQDARIESSALHTALHGDIVEARLIPARRGDEQKAEVVRIITRTKQKFVGAIEHEKGAAFLIPDDRHMYRDILIPNAPPDLPDGTKALVKMLEWSDQAKPPEGEILETIGMRGVHEVEMRAILLERGIETNFPAEVEKEAEEIKRTRGTITQEEIAQRRDMRDRATFTIDPDTAKDFDDALSVTENTDGTYEVGIHIADVSHYVTPGGALDIEARERAFSTYLVDRTIPMLPEILSNDLCSINPDEDKLVFSAVFVLDANAHIQKRWFGRAIIHSDKRFTYEEAQRVLDTGNGPHAKELLLLRDLAGHLAERKSAAGAIDFGDNEFKFELDANGRPVRIYRKERLETNRLIEDFMLLANREVAEFIHTAEKKRGSRMLIYRVHDMPNAEKLEDLTLFLKALGYTLPTKRAEISAQTLNTLFRDIEGDAAEALIKTATLRTMAKAVYSTKNIGHFGLGFPTYTHFTSPIRRYADLIVHRFLAAELAGKHTDPAHTPFYDQLAIKLSEKEIMIVGAERESIRRKHVEYCAERIGTDIDGIISGISEWGFYVEDIATGAEGLVRLRDMKDDHYILDQKHYRLVGEKKKKVYRLGDAVRAKIVAADPDRKTVDLILA